MERSGDACGSSTRPAVSHSQDCPVQPRPSWPNTTGCTCSPITGPRSNRNSKCSHSSRAPTTTPADSHCWPWWSVSSRPGTSRAAPGLFEAFPGQLSQDGMAVRVADALRRGALSHGLGDEPDVDFLAIDWFTHRRSPGRATCVKPSASWRSLPKPIAAGSSRSVGGRRYQRVPTRNGKLQRPARPTTATAPHPESGLRTLQKDNDP